MSDDRRRAMLDESARARWGKHRPATAFPLAVLFVAVVAASCVGQGASPSVSAPASATAPVVTAVSSQSPVATSIETVSVPAAPTPAHGTFGSTGALAIARYGATASLLPDGKVLVAGGSSGTDVGPGDLNSAEIYNPATGTFTATGTMIEGTTLQTATVLKDGRVLIVGGEGVGSGSATAEIYDPSTGQFSATGSMPEGREGHTATLLRDGRVLVVGGDEGYAGGSGQNQGDMLATAEIYDPTTGKFSRTGSMKAARSYHTATVLPDGEVLIAGGWDGSLTPLFSAEIYNPATGRFRSTGALNANRAFAEAIALPNGRVLVMGGEDLIGRAIASAEIYDPATGKFSKTGSMTLARESFALAELPTGRVLVAGGVDHPSAQWTSSAEVYNPTTGRFSRTGSAAQEFAWGQLRVSRTGEC